jgi:hypothetical protein
MWISAIIFSTNAIAIDSTSITTPATSSHMPSYILFLSPVLNEVDHPNYPTRTPVIRNYSTPANLNCPTGLAACVSMQVINSNFFKDECAGYFAQLIARSGIQKASGGGYTITYRYLFALYAMQPIPPVLPNGCPDKGGNFTLTVSCIAPSHLASSATSVNSDGAGPECVLQ